MKKSIIYCFIIVVPILLFSQKPFKFGKANTQDFELKFCPFYKEAKSMILGERGNIEFIYDEDKGWQYQYEYVARIKVFDILDADIGNIKLTLYQPEKSLTEEKITGVKAFVYNIENGKIEKEKVAKSDFFERRINAYWIEQSFAIPGLKSGSVFEYSYTKVSDYLYNLTDWIFQKDVPVASSELTFLIPEYFNYQENYLGNSYNFNKEEAKQSQTFTYSYSTLGTTKSMNSGSPVKKSSFVSQSNKTTVSMTQIPPLEDEPYMTNRSDMPSRLEFQLVSTQFPRQPVNSVAGSYEKLNNELMERSDFGSRLKKGDFLKDLDGLINGLPPMDKLVFIYNHVQKNIKWNGYKGVFSDKAGRAVFQEKEGSVDDINLTLIALLKNYGFESNPVILSTRGNGTIHPVYPSYDEFDYVIASVEMDDKLILLDASSSLPSGVLPLKCRNGKGWMVTKYGGKKVDLKSTSQSSVKTTYKCELTTEAFKINGSVTLGGYAAIHNTKVDSAETVKAFEEKLEVGDFDISNVKMTDYKRGELTSFSYDLEGEVADEIYFQPILDGTISENIFKRETRTSIVDFPYKQSFRVVTQIEYPEEYNVELPESTRFNLPNKKGSYSYSVSHAGNVITVISSVKIDETIFGVNEYPILKQFYQLVSEKNNELIVFTK